MEKVRNPVARDMRQRSVKFKDRRKKRSKDTKNSWQREWGVR